MKTAESIDSTTAIRQKFVEAVGHITQSLGAGRVLGQVFAHVYFSPQSQSLDDLTQTLGISKGSASMAVRQLEQWGALRRVWVKGDRKDYYEALDTLGRIIRKALVDMVGRQMETGDTLLEEAESLLKEGDANSTADAEEDFVRKRVERIRLFRDRTQRLWESSILTMLLK